MRHISDAMIDELVSPAEAQRTLHDAFCRFGAGEAAMQERVRAEAGGLKLSMLGAVIPGHGVAGAKVYTTIAGRFSFVILLFAVDDGRALASFAAASITRLRTAACSVIAARHLARPEARRLALFGAGVQGQAHARQMAAAFPLECILLCTRHPDPQLADRLARQTGVEVRLCSAEEALDGADIVVTATRASTPLFTGDRLARGSFTAAVGSSLPHTRELDDLALTRASTIAVEWRQQAMREAGDLVLAAPGTGASAKLVELGELVTGRVQGRRHADDITLYKSVGVGLEDVALAGLAWGKLAERC